MTQELLAEWRYKFNERIGILCGENKPTKEDLFEAKADADQWIKSIIDQTPVERN